MASAKKWMAIRLSLALVMTAAVPSVAEASDESVVTPETGEAAADAPRVTIGEHETEYVSWGRNRRRARNVELAASRLDGAWMAPGAVLSFDERVGPRSREAGFENAPVIANGRLREGVGGGVCQVATTLHMAAMEAGLVIVERRVHSFPSHYVAPGLDATVAEGRVDYRVKNPYPFPILVRAAASEGALRVTILGERDVPDVEIRARVVRELTLPDEMQEDPTLARGEEVVVQAGRRGYIVIVERTTDGREIDSERVRYAPAARIVRVGTGQ
jgi:vancomycin resistance protein YoaR